MASSSDLIDQLARRAALAGVSPGADVLARCAAYLEILAKWNRRMNLTALALEPPSDASIDRLIVEPLIAAAHIRPRDERLIDLGSGGGSPAIPLAIASPWVRLTMVEVREKKAAFLREAARATAVAHATVLSQRIEDLGDLRVNVVSARAIKLNDQILSIIARMMGSDGRLLWFRSDAEPDEDAGLGGMRERERIQLPSGLLTIFQTQ